MAQTNIRLLFKIGLNWSVTKDDPHLLTRAKQICDQLTHEEIMSTEIKPGHPFLHEVCHQNFSMFEFIQFLWNQAIFKYYWDNSDYLDKYDLTAFQRLALNISDKQDIQKWVRENMGVIPAKRSYDNPFSNQIKLITPYKL